MSAARRFLPNEPAEAARALVPIGLLLASALVPDAYGAVRWLVVVAIGLGTGIGIARAVPVRWAWAAALPAGTLLAWRLEPTQFDAGPSCIDAGAPWLVHWLVSLGIVVGLTAALALVLGATRTSLSLRLPARRYRGWAVAGLVGGFVATLLGGIALDAYRLGEPAVFWFGGSPSLEELSSVALAAVAFGIARGVADELTWRGALQGWSSQVIGIGPAIVGQALLVGLALLPYGQIALLGGVLALVLGALVMRTRSLLVSGAVNVGVGITLYPLIAC